MTGATTRLAGSPTTSYTYTGLTNGTAYTFQVAAVNVVEPERPRHCRRLPRPHRPRRADRRVGPAGIGQIALTWTAPGNGGAAITDYQVSVFNATGGIPTGVTGATTRNWSVRPPRATPTPA